MSTNAKYNPTLADIASRMGPDKRVDTDIIEALNETSELRNYMTTIEANGVTEHVTTVRTGLPTVAWKKLNWGVQPSKSTTKQVKDSLGRIEAWAEVDTQLLEINGWDKDFRFTEELAFVEAMNQKVDRAIFYGDNKKDPEAILGLTARYATGKKAAADNAVNVIDGGGTIASSKPSDLTSIWVMCCSPRTLFMTYPKGSSAGLKTEDKGICTTEDANGGKFDVTRTKFSWDVGLVLRDWRYVVRIANISKATLKADPSEAGAVDLDDLLSDAINRMPSLTNGGRFVICCNRTVKNCLKKQFKHAKNVRYGISEVAGQDVDKYDGIPIAICDALEFGEAKVPFDA